MDKILDPTDLINTLSLQERLDRAMYLAGLDKAEIAAIRLAPGMQAGNYDDLEGIRVVAEPTARPTDVDRAIFWVQKALEKSGIRHVRSGGSWGRAPNFTGPCCQVIRDGAGAMIVTRTSSIGE